MAERRGESTEALREGKQRKKKQGRKLLGIEEKEAKCYRPPWFLSKSDLTLVMVAMSIIKKETRPERVYCFSLFFVQDYRIFPFQNETVASIHTHLKGCPFSLALFDRFAVTIDSLHISIADKRDKRTFSEGRCPFFFSLLHHFFLPSCFLFILSDHSFPCLHTLPLTPTIYNTHTSKWPQHPQPSSPPLPPPLLPQHQQAPSVPTASLSSLAAHAPRPRRPVTSASSTSAKKTAST